MRSLIPICFLIPILLLASESLTAQERSIVVGAGYGVARAKADFGTIAGYEGFSDGESASTHAGAGIVLPLGNSDELGLIVRGAYAHSTYHYTHIFPAAFILLPGETEPVSFTDRENLDYATTDIGLELLLHYDLSRPFIMCGNGIGPPPRFYAGFGIAGGVGISSRSVETWEMTRSFTYPPSIRPWDSLPTRDHGHTLVIDDGRSRAFNPISVALLGSLDYALPLGYRVALVPSLGGRLDLLSPHTGTTARTVSLVGELALRYAL